MIIKDFETHFVSIHDIAREFKNRSAIKIWQGKKFGCHYRMVLKKVSGEEEGYLPYNLHIEKLSGTDLLNGERWEIASHYKLENEIMCCFIAHILGLESGPNSGGNGPDSEK